MELSVVVTIYNAEKSLPEMTERLQKVCSQLTNDFEIIYVEDRSPDRSWQVLTQLAKENAKVKCLRFSRNFGQHTAISAGLHRAKGAFVVMMDGDLQDEPETILSLYSQIKKGENQIIYVRRMDRKDSASKKISSRLFNFVFSKLSGINSDPSIGTFRIMTAKVVESFCRFPEVNKYIGGVFYWMNFHPGYLEAEHKERKYGKSNYTLIKMIRLATNGIVSFSNKPLTLSIYFGFFCALVSFLLGSFFLVRKIIFDISITGYSSIIVSIYFLSGIVLMVLGIIGKYIAMIYEQSRARPEYLVEEALNF
jgi:glycosyltransferase involved in cell wall biosynthesis